MTRRARLWLGSSVLALGAFGFGPQETTVVPRLAAPLEAYPDEGALGKVARYHLDPDKVVRKTFLLEISWSAEGTTTKWQGIGIGDAPVPTAFTQEGNTVASRWMPGARPDRDEREIQRLLDRLGPSEEDPPPIGRLLIVSFHREGEWTTRIYDRRRANPAYKALHAYLFKAKEPESTSGLLPPVSGEPAPASPRPPPR